MCWKRKFKARSNFIRAQNKLARGIWTKLYHRRIEDLSSSWGHTPSLPTLESPFLLQYTTWSKGNINPLFILFIIWPAVRKGKCAWQLGIYWGSWDWWRREELGWPGVGMHGRSQTSSLPTHPFLLERNLMRNAHFIHLFLNTQENTLEALKPGCLGLNPGFVS